MDLLANADQPTLAVGVGLLLLSLLGLLGLAVLRTVRRRRLPVAMQETQEQIATQEREAEAEPEPAGRSLEVRALRAQVHCLEQALEQLPEPAREPAHDAAALASYRAQVRATVRAVAADCAPGADARYVLGRLTAAFERLEQAGGLTRPALPVPVSLGVAVEAPALSPVPEPAVEPPDAQTADQPAPQPVQHPAEASRPDDEYEEHVVPVPPPAVDEPRRQRRRLRRSAA